MTMARGSSDGIPKNWVSDGCSYDSKTQSVMATVASQKGVNKRVLSGKYVMSSSFGWEE
jgi:hypothetical protein